MKEENSSAESDARQLKGEQPVWPDVAVVEPPVPRAFEHSTVRPVPFDPIDTKSARNENSSLTFSLAGWMRG